MNLDLGRPHGAGELLAMTFAFFREHATALFTMTLIVVAPVVIAIDGVWARGLADGAPANVPVAVTIVRGALQGFVVLPLVSALNAAAVLAAARGEEVRVRATFRAAAPRLAATVVTVVLTDVAVLLGLLALIVPGVFLAVRWYVGPAAAVVEGRAPLDALRRCNELVRGEWWPTFGCLLLALLTFGLLAAFGEAIGAALGNGALYISVLAVTQAVAASLAAIFVTLLFFDLRARKEPRSA